MSTPPRKQIAKPRKADITLTVENIKNVYEFYIKKKKGEITPSPADDEEYKKDYKKLIRLFDKYIDELTKEGKFNYYELFGQDIWIYMGKLHDLMESRPGLIPGTPIKKIKINDPPKPTKGKKGEGGTKRKRKRKV